MTMTVRAVERGQAADDRRVVAEQPIAVQLDEVRETPAADSPACTAAAGARASWTRSQAVSRGAVRRGLSADAGSRSLVSHRRGSRRCGAAYSRSSRPRVGRSSRRWHDQVDHAVLEQERRALRIRRQLLLGDLLDDARPGEADQRALLGDDDVADARRSWR